MNANQLNFHGVADGHGGVRMVPRKNSPVDRALRRLYGVSFTDQPIPLEPMNNLRVPWLPKGSPPDKRNTDRRMRDNGDPPPLDPDLRQLARNAGSSNMVEQVYAEQAKRDAKRGFDAAGNACDCTKDQGPSPTKAVQSVTRGVNRVSELGEEFNRDSRRRRGRDQQLPDPDQTMDPDEHQEPDGDEGQVIATMEAPPDGMRFALYQEGDQVAVVLEPDLGERDDPDLQTNDRTYRHRISDGKDRTLVRINQINRGHNVRDAVTSTLLRHRCLPGNKIVLRENEFGSIDVCLISWNPGEHMIINPQGSEELDDSDAQEMGAASWSAQPEESDPLQLQQPVPTLRSGDSAYRVSDTYRLSQMNREAKAFWSVKR